MAISIVHRNQDESISSTLYRKPTFSGLFLKWDSYVPKYFKKTLIYGLVNRAWKICSTHELFHQEIVFITSVLHANGYPINFVNQCVKQCLDKFHDTPHNRPTYGPEKKCVFLMLPYCGVNSMTLKRQLQRMLSAIAPWTKLRIVFKPARTLKVLSKLKSQIPLLMKTKVVYRVNCLNCSEFYIGKTVRNLGTTLKEHSTNEYSALYKHQLSKSHSIDFNHPSVVASDSIELRLLIKESLLIRDLTADLSLNCNVGSTELRLW